MTTHGRALLTDHLSLGGATEAPLVPPRQRRLARRHLWLVPGLAIAFYANAQAGEHRLGLGVLLLFGIVPHLPALLIVGQPPAGRWHVAPSRSSM